MLAPLQQGHRLFLAIGRDLFNSLQRNEAMPDLNNFMKGYALFHNSDQLVLKSSVHFCCPENKYKGRSAYQSIRICLICNWSIHPVGKFGGKITVISPVIDVICWPWLLVQVNSSPRAADSSINAVLSPVKGVFWYHSQIDSSRMEIPWIDLPGKNLPCLNSNDICLQCKSIFQESNLL